MLPSEPSASSDVRAFQNQVAGCHNGTLSKILNDDASHILKPYKLISNTTFGQKRNDEDSSNSQNKEIVPVSENEVGFYEMVAESQDDQLVKLRTVIPRFFGTRNIDGIEHIILEDMTAGMIEPCVLDLKLGMIRDYPGRSEEKILRARNKYPSTIDCGFCIAGMKLCSSDGNITLHITPPESNRLTTEQVYKNLESYLESASNKCNTLIQKMLEELGKVKQWANKQSAYIFRGSSILIVYDAANVTNSTNIDNKYTIDLVKSTCKTGKDTQLTTVTLDTDRAEGKRPLESTEISKNMKFLKKSEIPNVSMESHVKVKMIDFAHVFYSEGEKDQNYLFGLNNLYNFLYKFVHKSNRVGQ